MYKVMTSGSINKTFMIGHQQPKGICLSLNNLAFTKTLRLFFRAKKKAIAYQIDNFGMVCKEIKGQL